MSYLITNTKCHILRDWCKNLLKNIGIIFFGGYIDFIFITI